MAPGACDRKRRNNSRLRGKRDEDSAANPVVAGNLDPNRNPRNGEPYFNTSLFSPNALGTPGNAARRIFYGPGMDNFDVALHKITRFSESRTLEIRLETFNTFNHAQFFGANSVDGNIGGCDVRICNACGPASDFAGGREVHVLNCC